MDERKPVKLVKLKEGTKVVENGGLIVMDIKCPMDKGDYEFLKTMHENGISVVGKLISGDTVIAEFHNNVRSVIRADQTPQLE